MTIAIPLALGQIQGSEAFVSSCQSMIGLGMPHLTACGLSETWLLKELGHRHWQLIAQASGLDRPVFRDRAGDTVYAAFCGVAIRHAHFDALREHDDLVIASDIARVSRTQFGSRHRLSRDGRVLGAVEMLSVFVKRAAPGQNRSIVRAAVEGLTAMPLRPEFTDLVARVSALRRGDWTEHFGFRADDAEPGDTVTFLPCPSQDFNGAGLLYFSTFQAAVDRVEWATFGSRLPAMTTTARDIVYHGNVDIGEAIVVAILGSRRTADGLDHWCRVSTASSGRTLADVFSKRTRSGIAPQRAA